LLRILRKKIAKIAGRPYTPQYPFECYFSEQLLTGSQAKQFC